MSGVLHLRNILKLIIHGFYNGSFLSKSLSETLIKAPFMLLFSLVILAVIAMIVGKYHGINAVLFGIVFFIFTYRDKNKPSPGLTAAYSLHIRGYVAGIMAIAYGLVRFFE